ncbi:MAG: aminoacetone oxidase family FAD-binding enzyme [Ruminococcaceae bacterium]|nr:aminoacetone oxidase family FAD-binding enzyme [Oscillospiraceae bacterium]
MKTIKVYAAIIGGGASGLMCACVASKRNRDKKIVVIERDNRVGKKILVSGNSRCNLTNLCASINNYHTDFESGVIFLLENYPPQKVIDYFNSIGLLSKADNENRVYPLSKQSSAVLSVLRNELKRNGVDEICDTKVNSIEKNKEGYIVKCDDKTILAQKVVIATGGNNNYAQKVVGDTYSAAKSIGHTLSALSPSLSPVKVKKNIKALKGIRAQGKVSAVINGEVIKSECGEIQFGADSLSGICVFNLSREINKADKGGIFVELLTDYSFEEIKSMLQNRVKLIGNDSVQEIFCGLFHKNIGIAMLKDSNIDTSTCANNLSQKDINSLASTIYKWVFPCVKSNDFSTAQVTCGGIKGSEIDPQTLQSKKANNIYICGEAINVDGDCGGYNLQFAFSSGMCVGEQL